MRVSFRVILVIWIVFFAAFGGMLYVTYSRLQPETFVELLREQVEKNYPGASLEIGEVDYRPALDLSLTFKSIRIFRSDKILGSIGELEVRVPWWLLISDRGNAQININKLEIFLVRDEDGIHSLPQVKGNPQKIDTKIKLAVPDYLAQAKYTLRAKDIIIRDSEDSRRYFALSKLLVKEFQYGKNSAFELNLPIEISHNRAKFTSELWLFGDITPDKDLWQLNFRGEFKTRDLTDKSDLEDLAIDGKTDFKPGELNLVSQLAFRIERAKVGEGKITADKSELNVEFDFTAFPLEYLGIFSEELKNPYLPLLSGPTQGSIRIQRKFRPEAPAKLEARFGFDGVFPLDSNHTYAGKWQFSFTGSKWETSFITPRSEVSFFRRSIIDVPKGEVVQFIEEIGFTGIDVNPAMHSQMTLAQYRSLTFPHYYSTKVSLSGCTHGEELVSGTLLHGYTPHSRFYKLDLKGNGTLKLDYLNRDKTENISLKMAQFSWSKGYNFFNPIFMAEEGVVSGELDGNFDESWSTGSWLTQLKFTGLKAPAGILPNKIQKIWEEFSVDVSGTGSHTLNASLKDQVIQLKTLAIDGTESARITGTLTPDPKKSFLILNYPKNKKWKPVRKDIPEFKW